MSNERVRPEIPVSDAFRKWLSSALSALDIKPASLAVEIGASINSVGAFLRDPSRDIRLGRAHEIERHLRRVARERGKSLPSLRAPALTGKAGVS